jgi:hypothetical protein
VAETDTRPEHESDFPDEHAGPLYPDWGDHIDDNTLAQIAARALSDIERTYVEAHMDRCAPCRELVYAILDAHPDPALVDQAPTTKPLPDVEPSQDPPRPIPLPRVITRLAVAAAVLATVTGTYFYLRPGTIEVVQVDPADPPRLVNSTLMGSEEASRRLELLFPSSFDGEVVVLGPSSGNWKILGNSMKVRRRRENLFFGLPVLPSGTALVFVASDAAPTPLAEVVESAGMPEGTTDAALAAWKTRVHTALLKSGRHRSSIGTVVAP